MTKYRMGLELYRAVRDDFVAGKSAREIGLEHAMEPINVLGFLHWIRREFEIERLVRSDQLKGKLFKIANNLAGRAAAISENGSSPEEIRELMDVIDKIHAIFAAISKEDREFQRARKLPAQSAEGAAKGDIDDLVNSDTQTKRGRPSKLAN